MTDLRIVASDGADRILEDAEVAAFAAELRGPLLRQGDAGYDAARRVWNGMIDRRPALIARCAGVADVMAAVRFARDRRLLVSVKGGGHNITGNAVCEGGLMIDLSPMKSVRVDPQKRTARAEAGLTWGEFNRETQAFGLATTGGVVSTTGIAGLTLGGGLGWLMGKHGLSCDNLLSADIVTADGQFLTASAGQHPDLFWGAARRRRQLRRRHLVRVSPASGDVGAGGDGRSPDGEGQGIAALLSRFRAQLAG
jgi:FAD/FMN-containing dehydrogenase